MNKVMIGLAHAAMLLGCVGWQANAEMLTLAERGREPEYTIVLPESPSKSQTFAATELKKYIRQMTGVALPVATNVVPARGIFLGNGASDLGNDGFRLVAKPPHFRIEGSDVHGTLFGVYDFLERFRKFNTE